MNKAYRLIWSAHQGAFVAVAENVPSRGKRSSMAVLAAGLLVSLLAGAVEADVIAASPQTRLVTGLNGVQIVDIASTNAAGVSHNQYQRFDVDQRGLVLNNIAAAVGAAQSQLAGRVESNLNLGQSARLIINEVLSANRSQLNGYLEVVGGRADVMVANPWGISCNGCGFINTDRVTLSTGVPFFHGDGTLAGLRVNQGEIRVNGKGLNASAQSLLDLVSRQMVLDGQLNAKQLRVVTGSNEVDYASLSAKALPAGGEQPAYAIDSTALGGMYADRISIIATEAGSGVRMLGDAAAGQGGFTLDSAGGIVLKSALSATEQLAVRSTQSGKDALQLDGARLSAGQDLQLAASTGDIRLMEGSVQAGKQLDITAANLVDTGTAAARRHADGQQTVRVSGHSEVASATYSAGSDLDWQGGSLKLTDASFATGLDTKAGTTALRLKASQGDLQLGKGQLQGSSSVSLQAADGKISLDKGGVLKAGGPLDVLTGQALVNAGEIAVAGTTTISTGSKEARLENSGKIESGGNLLVGKAQQRFAVDNSGTVLANAHTEMQATRIDNSHIIQSASGSHISTDALHNSANGRWLLASESGSYGTLIAANLLKNEGQIQSSGTVSLTAGGEISNSGQILQTERDKTTSLRAGKVANSGQINSASQISIDATRDDIHSLVNGGQIVAAHGSIALNSTGKVINAGRVISERTLTLTTPQTIENTGRLQSADGMTIGLGNQQTAQLDNSATGVVVSGGNLVVDAANVRNSGIIQSQGDTTATGKTLVNAASSNWTVSLGGGESRFDFSEGMQLDGVLQSGGSLTLSTPDKELRNRGTVLAGGKGGKLTLEAANLVNSGDIRSGGDVKLQATAKSGNSVANSGLLTASQAIDLQLGHTLANSGSILAGEQLTVAGKRLANSGSLQSGGKMLLGSQTSRLQLDNDRALDLGLAARTTSGEARPATEIYSQGDFTLWATDIANQAAIQSDKASLIDAATLGNRGQQASWLAAGKDQLAKLTISGVLDNEARLGSSGTLEIQADSLNNTSGATLFAKGSQLQVQAAKTVINNGTVYSDGTLSLQAKQASGPAIDNGGTLYSAGEMTLDTAADLQNRNGGKIIADASIRIGSAKAQASFDNAGTVYAADTFTLGKAEQRWQLDNRASGKLNTGKQQIVFASDLNNAGSMVTAGKSQLQGQRLVNTGTLTVADAGESVTVDFSQGILNQGTLQGAGSLVVENHDADFVNEGTVQAVGSQAALRIDGKQLRNSSSGKVLSAGSLTLGASASSGASLDNQGEISGQGALKIQLAANLGNQGKMLSGNTLDVQTSHAAGVLDNKGQLESQGAMTLGNSTQRWQLDNGQGSKIVSADTLTIQARDINNLGTMQSAKGSQIDAANLNNGSDSNSNALIMAAIGSGQSQLVLSGNLVNKAAIHSQDKLAISAQHVSNSQKGGLSSLATLDITSRSDIQNMGALYAGELLKLDAAQTLRNATDATIDSSQTLQTVSASFYNNGLINTGSADISTSQLFSNGMDADLEIREDRDAPTSTDRKLLKHEEEDTTLGISPDGRWLYEDTVTYKEKVVGELPKVKPQLLASGNIKVSYGSGRFQNLAGLMSSATDIDITGTGDFVQKAYQLHAVTYARRVVTYEENPWEPGDPSIWRYWVPTSKAEFDKGIRLGSGWHGDGGGQSVSGEDQITQSYLDQRDKKALPTGYSSGIFAGGKLNIGARNVENVGNTQQAYVNSTSKAGVSVGSGSQIGLKDAGQADSTATVETGTTLKVKGVGTQSVNAAAQQLAADIIAASQPLGLGKFTLNLPKNPNGMFVPTKDPQSEYLVESNPRFSLGTAVVSSSYLEKRLGFSPDKTLKRLGDGHYEAWLVRQQLIAETGNNLLRGEKSEAAQFQKLFDSAAGQASKLGLSYGKPLTAAQAAALTEDIVWMEKTTVGGVAVLVPRVYLSADSRARLQEAGSATLAGSSTTITASGSLSNTGGTIEGGKQLTLNIKGDLVNTSGDIKGGNVKLDVGGNLRNETLAVGNGDALSYQTNIGKKAGISASGNLDVIAKGDISVKGADVSASGKAKLKSGGSVTFDTIVDRTTTSEVSSGGGGFLGLMGSSSTKTTTTTSKNIGSGLKVGGNLTVESGKETTIAGSKVEVGGDLTVDAKGGLNVLARQDSTQTRTETQEKGIGVGGGLAGSQKTTTDSFKGTNMGSDIKVGGNATLSSGKDLTVQGSNVEAKGKLKVSAKGDVNVLDGLDEERTTTVTETTTFLKLGGRSESSAKSSTDSAAGKGKAGASAGAEAKASNSHELRLMETSTKTSSETRKTSVASTLKSGGGMEINGSKVTVQGSNLDAGGDLTFNADELVVKTGRNEVITSEQTNTTSIGFYGEANSEAKSQAGSTASGRSQTAAANASAEASADYTMTIGAKTEKERSDSYTLTNTASKIGSRGNMKFNVKKDATFVGAEVKADGDIDINATNVNNLAAQDIQRSSNSSSSNLAGLYIGGEAKTETTAGARTNGGQLASGQASGSVEASASVSAGLRNKNESSSETSGSVTQKTSSFTSGGNITRKASGTIRDQGTQLDAKGNIIQSAANLIEEEVHDSSYSSKSEQSHDARIGVQANVKAEAKAGGGGGTATQGSGKAEADASAGAGFGASYKGEITGENESEKKAVTSRYKAGGNIVSTVTGKTVLVGTNIEAGGDVKISSGSLDYKAATDSSSKKESSHEIEFDAKVNVYGSPGAEINAGYAGKGAGQGSTTQTGGSIKSGGAITVTTTDDASFTGTNFDSKGKTTIDAGGSVDMKAAVSTERSNSTEGSVSASLSVSKGANGAKGSKGGELGGEVQHESSNSSKAQGSQITAGGGIQIKAGKDVRTEGASIKDTGKAGVEIEAGGKVELKAARNTESEFAVGGQISLSAESGEEGSQKAGAGNASIEGHQKVESTASSIETGGKLTIKAKQVVNQEATLKADEGKSIAGQQIQQKLENSSSAGGFSLGVGGGSSTEGNGGEPAPAAAGGAKTAAPAKTNNKPPLKRSNSLPSSLGSNASKSAAKTTQPTLKRSSSMPSSGKAGKPAN